MINTKSLENILFYDVTLQFSVVYTERIYVINITQVVLIDDLLQVSSNSLKYLTFVLYCDA